MHNLIPSESIIMAPTGVPVGLEALGCQVAATLPAAMGTPAGAIEDDLLIRLLAVQLGDAVAPVAAMHRWYAESVRLLRSRGHQPGGGDPAAVWAEWDTRSAGWAQDPGLRAQVRLLDATLPALPRILTGAIPATDVMFPGSSMSLVEGIYRNNPVTDTFNAVMARTVAAVRDAVVAAEPANRLRLLEIGAGTGGGSAGVLEQLRGAPVETYSYTDLSRSFLLHAEREFGPQHAFLDYQILDIEHAPQDQGFTPGSYDLVLATNVLHATADIRRTLRHAKALLKRGGVLLLNEISAYSVFAHLTFGLLDGWWRYQDADLRIAGTPALAPDTWLEVLEEEGFDPVAFPAAALHGLGYQVVAAASDGLIRQQAPSAAAEPPPQPEPEPEPVSVEKSGDGLRRHVEDAIFAQLKSSLKLGREHIAADDAFMDHGIDSILGVQLIQQLNRVLGIELSTTDLFDHGSVTRLAGHIAATYPNLLPSPPETVTVPQPRAPQPAARAEAAPAGKEPIAIVGMSGRFAGSDDPAQLWEHLERGDDLVGEVTRWDLPASPATGADACRHGSFLDRIDLFDPIFFNISGVEARYMDPQQRIFLEECWKALEDAGYAGRGTRGRRCGVYAGCQESGYGQLIGGEAPASAMWGNALSAMPARIAYHLDLRGPAVSVDTACSSSLVAIHLACQGLWTGETGMALAGGVSVQCTPRFYQVAGHAGMLSPSGRCHTFDERADGFVPGEGAAVLVLKRLSDALADGDHIHGIIRGSGTNQDGASNGLTAPSAASQERLLTSVYDEFGIDPAGIQMVEAHGTGTKLGDPIEYHALQRAFTGTGPRTSPCALGSIKSNLGHTITAAGVAGMLKVLLSLRHRVIPPSLHFEQGNAHIDFTGGPFAVPVTSKPWNVPAGTPRRAAVSSFGVTGTNAHLVIEQAPAVAPQGSYRGAELIVLSAHTPEQLREQAERLAVRCADDSGLNLGDVSFTLLTGRKHLPHRLACVATTTGGLVTTLRAWLADQHPAGVHAAVADVAEERPALRAFGADCIRRVAAGPSAGDELSTVADLWSQGYDLPYEDLFLAGHDRRVPLPTYPFARESYWVPAAPQETPQGAADVLHPMVHTNVSTLREHCYRTAFTGSEPFFTDHRVQGRKVLPGVAFLEMARAASAAALDDDGTATMVLRNVVWARPLVADPQPPAVLTTVTATGSHEVAYEFTGADGQVHGQGRAAVEHRDPVVVDLSARRAACTGAQVGAGELYPAYEKIGFSYGPLHRGIERLYAGPDEVLVRLVLPEAFHGSLATMVLHPGLLDATLQASLGMGLTAGSVGELDVTGMKPSLPFALDELEVHGPGAPAMWAWIRYSGGVRPTGDLMKLDVDLCDDDGRVRARLRGMSYRILDGDVTPTAPIDPATPWLSLRPRWERHPATGRTPQRTVVLVPGLPELVEALPASDASTDVIPLTSTAGTARRYTEYAEQALAWAQRELGNPAAGDTLVQLVVPEEPSLALSGGLLGLLQSAATEQPRLSAQAVYVDTAQPLPTLVAQVLAARHHRAAARIRFRDGEAEAQTWEEPGTPAPARLPWRTGGVYLITGGLGGLGRIVAADLVDQVREVTLVLAGRSAPDTEQTAVLEQWRSRGATVTYVQADVSDAQQAQSLIAGILREHGTLHGILHSAGVLRDALLGTKTAADCRVVLAPKVAGTVHLDEATREVQLDFFALFSGLAGIFGNTGQADYTAANAFLDAYAAYRHTLVAQGRRSGASVSIAWPLWAHGGMQVDAATERTMRERLGMVAMGSATGLAALHAALTAGDPQVVVVAGDLERIRTVMMPAPEKTALTGADLVGYLRGVLSEALQIPVHRIDPAAPFDRFGIDSVLALSVTNRLENDFGSLSKTLLFEHRSVQALSEHLQQTHTAAVSTILGVEKAPPALATVRKEEAPTSEKPRRDDDVAVVALAGRYPGAADLDEFWDNLVAGRDCVTEVPAQRWDRTAASLGWGGFLDGVADFDPLFFHISPREAAVMDPQTRLFLQCVWTLLEGAGYTRQTLRERYDGSVGVYVGAMYHQYQLLAADPAQEALTSVVSYSAIANRVSHFFDLRGPSLAVDTTCSSSLAAIHMACEELRRGTCDMMIAGGVNLSLHPKKYAGLEVIGLTGSGPHSRAFLDGDGFIPAEGVGAVLLKPLARAVADGDDILTVIRASGMNHKGGSGGPVVPDPDQQVSLIEANLRRCGVHPRTVSYVEASANGSPLGDALEMAALKRVYGDGSAPGHCALGSVKSGIGNAEAASGIAQLSKVALQMRHRMLAPLVGTGSLNPSLDLEHSAFHLPRKATKWERPVVDVDGVEREYPLRATISAFGAGGSNAHLVLEEYVAAAPPEPHPDAPRGPLVVPLSARTGDRLEAVTRQLISHLDDHPDVVLDDLAYTLQQGREVMECRLAVVAADVPELITGLRQHLGSDPATVAVFTGEARHGRSDLAMLLGGDSGEALLRQIVATGSAEQLAMFWAQGGDVPWTTVAHTGPQPRMLRTLPTYPFERHRLWLDQTTSAATPATASEDVPAAVADLLGLPVSALDLDAPLPQLGFSSMHTVQLAQRLGAEPQRVAASATVRDLARRLTEQPERAVAPHFTELVPLNSGRTGRPVFWCHGGLGGVEVYAPLAAAVGRPFYGIQARGWMSEEPPLHGIAAMAAHYAGIIQAVQPEGPYDVGGYSLGGLLAYEVTRQLQQRGATVDSVVMLDAMYGEHLKNLAMSRRDLLLQQVNALLFASLRPEPAEFAGTLVASVDVNWDRDDDAVLEQLVTLARGRGLRTPPGKLRDLLAHNADVHEAYDVLGFDVQPLPQPGAVTCFYLRNGSGLFYGELASVFSAQDGPNGVDHTDYWSEWQRRIPQFHLRDVDSPNHFVLLSHESSAAVAAQLCTRLYTTDPGADAIEATKRWMSGQDQQ
ncbi:SDR family NAD(P)-dependent oxidoreductase [Actinoplanes sp. TFC3]|uniref:SDR family NAD(P)-dependent oxidoreductase n=1 Tax=Actinoplanes sp. TFC3 TaxID=1710355 RepID=UPI00082E7C65|nr:SDR family NAD(P)-dependent oxidoreductase [Actinoplanes sp. TFC3]